MGYRGVDVFAIDSSVVNAEGNFELHYPDTSLGMGYLLTAEDNSYMVVLEKGKVISFDKTEKIIKKIN
jgi:hypothetical protein